MIHKVKIEKIGKNISDKNVALACFVIYFATNNGKKAGTYLSTLTVSKKKINATFFVVLCTYGISHKGEAAKFLLTQKKFP